MKKVAFKIVLIALSCAIVSVFTSLIRIPVLGTGGYISLCDVAVTFFAYSFGPVLGFLAGGLGTAISDLIGGYAQFAPISFVVHGIEGLLIGLIVRGTYTSIWRKLLAGVVATLTVACGYFSLTGLFLTTFSEALTEFGPNLIQGGVGAVLGLLLYLAVSRAFKNLDSYRIVFSFKKKKTEVENI